MTIRLEGFVGGCIERILQVLTKLGVLHVVGICQQGCPFTLWVIGFQLTDTVVGHIHPALSRIEQIEVIPGFIAMFIVRIVVCQSAQVSFTQLQVVHLILQDDACLEQGFLDNLVTDFFLFVSKGYLCQIELTFMWICSCLEGCAVDRLGIFWILKNFLFLLSLRLLSVLQSYHRLIAALPVVSILTLTPLTLESCLSLTNGCWIIKVPLSVTCSWHRGGFWCIGSDICVTNVLISL